MADLETEVRMMCELSYVREAELPKVPKVAIPSSGIVYGPLREFPTKPDAVLLWVTPGQAMVMGESCGSIDWSAPSSGLLGRPGCAGIPLALNEDRAELSLGCVGMRVNTGIPAELSLMVVPGSLLATLEAEVDRVCRVHRELVTHYERRMADAAVG
jgi:uncharacterized protein (DUF169 family)